MNDTTGGAEASLFARASELEDRIRDLSSAKTNVDHGKVLDGRRKRLSDAATSIANAAQIHHALRSRGIELTIEQAFFYRSLLQWQDLRAEQLKANQYLASAEGIAALRTQLEFLPKLVRSLQDESRRAWASHVDQMLPDVDLSLLAALESIPHLQVECAGLRRTLDHLGGYRSTPPRSAESIDDFRASCEKAAQKWRALQSHGIPSEVLRFFADLKESGNRLPLSKLSESVRTYLDIERISDKIYVTAG